MATATTDTKHCPGVLSLGLEAHDLPATGENFSTNKSMKDGYATRCRRCDGAYGKAWLAAKKAGTTFSAKVAPGEPVPAAPAPAAPAAQEARYADELAERLAGALQPGWTTEVVAGVVYALPDGESVSTPEGQAALELVNKARVAERRRRATEAKRAQRARAKEATPSA